MLRIRVRSQNHDFILRRNTIRIWENHQNSVFFFVFLQASVNLCLICLDVKCGVPQGRVIGPSLFLSMFFQLCNRISHHRYANDTQLYTSVSPGSLHAPVTCLTDMNNVDDWKCFKKKKRENRNASLRTGWGKTDLWQRWWDTCHRSRTDKNILLSS